MVVQTSFSHLINNHPALSYKNMIYCISDQLPLHASVHPTSATASPPETAAFGAARELSRGARDCLSRTLLRTIDSSRVRFCWEEYRKGVGDRCSAGEAAVWQASSVQDRTAQAMTRSNGLAGAVPMTTGCASPPLVGCTATACVCCWQRKERSRCCSNQAVPERGWTAPRRSLPSLHQPPSHLLAKARLSAWSQ